VPVYSLRYKFRQPLSASAETAYAWCTDFGPDDGSLFAARTRRSVRFLSEDALVMTDLTYPRGRALRIRRLVRLNPAELAWTNTHLDGPYRHSQYWYRIVPDGPRRSHLEFVGLRLESSRHRLRASEIARRAEACRTEDSDEWRRRLAPALERDLAPRAKGGPRRRRGRS
jgi:hypothetical protein